MGLVAAGVLLGFCAAAALAGAPAQARPRLVHAGATGTTGTTGTTGATGSTGSSGSAGAAAANPSVSSNWAGYAVQGPGATVTHFTRVAGTWIAPTITCTPGSATYSAFWVGLGGYATTSKHLEQIGTEADCDSQGIAHYFAWYELVPRGSVTLALPVAPGDVIATAVKASPGAITFTLTDRTTGARFHRRIAFANADTTSAEWIAEAPSNCNADSCRTLPLGDFGTVTFTGATVRTRAGVRGPISGTAWSSVPIALDERSGSLLGDRFGFGARALVGAVPTVLSDAGGSFAVSWEQQTPPAGP